MKQLLVFDLSNLCYIGAKSKPLPEAADESLYFDNIMAYLRAQFRYFKPDQVVFACDHEDPYWRSSIYPEYKAHRPDNDFKQTIRRLIKRIKTEHSHLCLEVANCEADDVIYALCQFTDFHITILSSDSDFEQLLSERVRLFSPMRRQFCIRPKDIAFQLFVKCIRGDRSDNIPSALPLVQRKRLLEAYRQSDPVTYLSKHFQQQQQFSQDFSRNKSLIDLHAIPEPFISALKHHVEQFFTSCTNLN